jgi:CRP-like cAMP-binding protein
VAESTGTQRGIDQLLARHPLLEGLPADALELVAGCSRNAVFDAGSLLFLEGEPADTLYLVRRGAVSLETYMPGRGTLVIETFGPGDVIGWSWLFPPYVWQFDARATEPLGTLTVDAACLRAKAESDPRFGYELMKRFASIVLERLQAARFRLLDLYASEADTMAGPGGHSGSGSDAGAGGRAG